MKTAEEWVKEIDLVERPNLVRNMKDFVRDVQEDAIMGALELLGHNILNHACTISGIGYYMDGKLPDEIY